MPSDLGAATAATQPDADSTAAVIRRAAASPQTAAAGFGVYVHVPFCVSRCGYCDFNTYTASELGAGVSRETYAGIVRAEIRLAAGQLTERSEVGSESRTERSEVGGESRTERSAVGGESSTERSAVGGESSTERSAVSRGPGGGPSGADREADGKPPRVDTVFFGGGTPTLLPADDLVAILAEIDRCFGLAPGAEVTTEANPESVDAAYFARLRDGGFTRVSIGMQSTASHVLRVLDREHSPQKALAAVADARAAGFEHVSLDLIYGTPGETPADFTASLKAAVDSGVDHVSAYALIVEDGTALARRIRAGSVPRPSDDVAADRYLAAEAALTDAGFDWYEVSNWSRTSEGRCRHNLLYWEGGHWWGAGPGAHSHLPGLRWWNHKHPSTWAAALAAGIPAAGHELLTNEQQYLETVMLRTRLADGLPVSLLRASGAETVERLVDDGLAVVEDGALRLTLRGRLLADAVVRDLTE